MDDESLRHHVIMVLLDILMANEQPMTLKELVKQLGHYNDFSSFCKGLRRITGKGVEGLPGILVLLWQYPSLFTVSSGKVSITSAVDLNEEISQELEQTKVAIDFYEFQLRRLGAYSVPISRVLEMRSQASKYVKQISGNTLKELSEFLKCHSDVFAIISDECVVLCEHLKRATINGHTITRIDAPIELDEKVFANTRIIVNSYHGRQIVDNIFETTNVVTVDLEGVNLGSIQGSITLIQVAFLPKHLMSDHYMNGMNGSNDHLKAKSRIYPKIFIFDVYSNPNLIDYCLKRLLESNRIMKVFHGCEEDSYALRRDFGVFLNNFIDTQAAHTVITGMSCDTNRQIRGNGQQSTAIGLNGLYEEYGGYGCNPLKAVIKKRYVGNSHFWCERPLTQEMVYYAAYDVYVLLGTYLKMSSFISKLNDKNAKYFDQLNRRAAFGRAVSDEDRHYDRCYNYRRRHPFPEKTNPYLKTRTYR